MPIALDGTLVDWTPADRLETAQNSVPGYALYGRFENGAFVLALSSPDAIGPNSTFWLNTDGNAATGYQVWDFAVGAEFNVNFGTDGIPRLYTGGSGQTLVGDIEYALSADRTTLEMRLPQSLLGTSVTAMAVYADLNDTVFLPTSYSSGGYVVAEERPSSFDGVLTEWTSQQRLDTPDTGVTGYALYGRIDPDDFVIALQSAQPIGANSTFWINVDGDVATGHKIWGWAGGAEFNVNVGADGIARLYSGAAGEIFVSELDFKIGPDGMSIELAIPKTALGANVEQIAVLADINDSVFLPNNYGFGGYTLATPPVSAFDGVLSEWTQNQRLETPITTVSGYELYGRADDDAFVVALKSDIAIGAGTTFWINTDGNIATGHLVWGWATGAEFNVNFGSDGIARLYTGDAGQTLVSQLDFAIGPDGKTLELAIPKSLLGTGVGSIGVMADINNVVHLPADYTQPAYVIEPTAPPTPPASYKVAIVYSETTAGAYWSEMAYSQLVMAAQSQAISAGIPFDLIGEADLTDMAKLSQYSALVFPSFRNVPSNYAQIAATLQELIYDHDVSLIAAGDFMTNAGDNSSLPGNAYERMQTLFGLTRSGGDSGVTVDLVANGANDITQGYTDGAIRTYTGAATSYFSPVVAGASTVFAQQVVGGVAHDAVVSTTTGGRNVHFATEGMLADNNLLGQSLDWSTQIAQGPKVSLSMSRDAALVASRNDMDQSQESFDVDSGIYDVMLPILEQWKAQYNFVGSYYINVGLNPPDQTTDWFVSSQYYDQLLAMGNEIGSHSYTHPHDTNLLLKDAITDAELDAYVAAVGDLLEPAVRQALTQMTAAEFMTRLAANLLVADPQTLDAVNKAVLSASFTFQFLHARQEIEENLGIVAGGAAVPGMPETLDTARQIIQHYEYLSGGASMIGAGYPGAFGFLTPNETEKVYIAPNMSFDFTLTGWLGLTPEEATAKWMAELDDLTVNADLPILVWPWHDYGPTTWDIDGTGASDYTLAMFTSFLAAAHAKGAEFVTLRDLASRITAFEKTELSYAVNGDTITVAATPAPLSGALGTFAINLDTLGTQTIASVTNWYAYDGNSVFLDSDGGAYEIKLGASAADVTHITAIGARIQLISLTGDGVNLNFTMHGEGLVTVDLAMAAGQGFAVSGAQVVSQSGDILTLRLPTIGTHSVSLVRQDTVNAPPTDIVVSNQVAVPELTLDRIKIADLTVIDPNVQAHLRNNTVTVSDDRFEIDPIDGGLYRKAGTAFDFETQPEINLILSVSDGEFPAITKPLSVRVANVNEAPTGGVAISGEAVENQTLVADVTTLGDPDGLGTLSYRWQRDTGSGFADIAGATAQSYVLTNADAGNLVRAIASYTDAGGTLESLTSPPTATVVNVNSAPTGGVTITGQRVQNQTLTADTTTLADGDGLGTLTYQWQRNSGSGFANIAGATAASYLLVAADAQASVRVIVSYLDAKGTTETVTSPETGAVSGVPVAIVLTPLVEDMPRILTAAELAGPEFAGMSVVIENLAASTGTLAVNPDGTWTFRPALNDDTGVSFSYSVRTGTTTRAAAATLDLVGMTDVMGTTGNDNLAARTTADQYHGLAGNDVMRGGAGNDFFFGGPGTDTIYGDAGNDTAFGEAGNDVFFATLSDGNDIYDGGADTDTLNYGVVTANAVINLGAGTATSSQTGTDTLVGIENAVGGSGNDTMTGSAGNNVLSGGAGNDLFYGGAGNDTVNGDGGNDSFFAAANDGNDTYNGGTGTDTLDFSAITAAATINLTAGSATSAQTGTDALATLEHVVGGSGNDTIVGSSGANTLSGGGGNDGLEGMGGKDLLTGGAGSDSFIFRTLAHSQPGTANRDIVTDFTRGSDRIDLSGIDASTRVAGDQAFVFIATAGAAFGGIAGQLRFVFENNAGTANDRTLVHADVNGDRAADFSIELTGLVPLTASDFIL